MSRKAWIVTLAAMVAVCVAMGTRQSFGIFLAPISLDLQTGREVFSLAIAIQNLVFGLAQPLVGMVADKYGAGRVIAVGTVLYIAGLALAGLSQSPGDLHLTLGVLVGLAQAGTTYVVVLGAVGRIVPPQRRGLAFGLVTGMGSFGMFAVVPGAQALLDGVGWRDAFLLLALFCSILFVCAMGQAGKPRAPTDEGADQTARQAWGEASGHSGYWLLTTGFFVCGFHVAFVATHLPAYLADNAISPAVSALSLALIGLFNILGSFLFGWLGGIRRKKYVLAWIYLARAALFCAFLVLPLTPLTALAFGALIGFLWLGTVPVTSALVAQLFGTRYLSMLYGFVFLSHQIGAFLGVWLGGRAHDVTGSYDAVWWMSVGLALLAALIHLPIRDAPVPRLSQARAAV